MKDTLKENLTHCSTRTVTPRELVPQVFPDHEVFSALPDVFATAFMVGFIEATCAELLHEHLEEGESSVGIKVDVSHIAATPPGMQVTAKVELVEIDRRRIRFAVKAHDERDLICEGFHERFIINDAQFRAKVLDKQSA